jgi:hypothetical protein
MVKGDHPGGSLAGNESLLASSTRSVGLGASEACRLSPGTAPVSAFPAPARSSGLIIARSLDGLIRVFLYCASTWRCPACLSRSSRS